MKWYSISCDDRRVIFQAKIPEQFYDKRVPVKFRYYWNTSEKRWATQKGGYVDVSPLWTYPVEIDIKTFKLENL